ncbi:MAG: hypothetical protein IPO40_24230 [Fibrobacteres bacterium]|nr:hypothetical protein [Fibrobacterota bacterium]
MLSLKGTPIQLAWLREIGTTWRYAVSKPMGESDLVEDHKFRQFVKYGYLGPEPLSQQFQYILKLLHSGRYELSMESLPKDMDLVELKASKSGYGFFNGYGGIEDVIATQERFDEKTLDDYMKAIQGGLQPILVVLTSHSTKNKLILDGHHKYLAYCRLKKHPRALVIKLLNPTPIPRQDALKIFDSGNPKGAEYKDAYAKF